MMRAGTCRFYGGILIAMLSAGYLAVQMLTPEADASASAETTAKVSAAEIAAHPFGHCAQMRVTLAHQPPLTAELALSRESQRIGLMHRTDLDPDSAMLFIFPEPREVGFWMRDTQMPLDMIFIAVGGRIVKVHRNAEPGAEQIIASGVPVIAVLETVPGRLDGSDVGGALGFDCIMPRA